MAFPKRGPLRRAAREDAARVERRCIMQARTIPVVSSVLAAAVLSVYLVAQPMAKRAQAGNAEDGVVRVRSAYSLTETLDRLKKDVAAKGIMMFSEIDQGKLAANAGIKLGPSVLLVFGNPALGSQFITSKPQAGLDWPVRLLVQEDESGRVWANYTDFAWIARRHQITDREEAFKMASSVIASITSSIAKQ
jgi:uncharacterized protein (DUF302 family)